jgi:hypothetical protein
VRVNGPRSRFATLGCDHWVKPVPPRDGVSHEAGIYVDLVFDRLETAASRRNYVSLFRKLRERASARSGTEGPGVSIIRMQPQRVDFTDLKRGAAWMLSTWVFGGGRTEAEAISFRRRGLDEVEKICDLVSSEIAAKGHGRGTPVPP